MTAKKPSDTGKPTVLIQGLCIMSLVALTAIDAFSTDFSVNTFVYAIIAGVLLGVGSLKQIFGGNK